MPSTAFVVAPTLVDYRSTTGTAERKQMVWVVRRKATIEIETGTKFLA